MFICFAAAAMLTPPLSCCWLCTPVGRRFAPAPVPKHEHNVKGQAAWSEPWDMHTMQREVGGVQADTYILLFRVGVNDLCNASTIHTHTNQMPMHELDDHVCARLCSAVRAQSAAATYSVVAFETRSSLLAAE